MREFDLLEQIFRHNDGLPDTVVIPPGDDLGAIEWGGLRLLVGVDQVADGVHVDAAATPIELIGRKAVNRSLSDVAAMAARPLAAVATGALPRRMGRAAAQTLFEAMRAAASACDCPLLGGDVLLWDRPLLLTVTVMATPDGLDPVLRSGARVDDAIYVSGALGASLSTGHHLRFEPRIELARALAGDPGTRPCCMIDLSDGLARDLGHLCADAEIDAASLPLRPGADGWRSAVGDGEDYELLFTAPAGSIPASVLGVPITRVGRVTGSGGLAVLLDDGSRVAMSGLGWEHGR